MYINTKFKLFFTIIIFITLFNSAFAQISICELNGSPEDECFNVVSTAVPLLRATSDARSGAMGDVGLAISADANSLFWNASKLAFAENNSGLSISFTPWLSALVNDVYLSNITGFYRPDDQQAIAASFRYFTFGSITFTDDQGTELRTANPQEFYIDLGYSRKLSNNFGLGLGLKYVNSDLASGTISPGGNVLKAGQSAAADISFFYTKLVALGGIDGKLSAGLAISNLGNRISYSDDAPPEKRDFIPANFGIGTALEMDLDEYNSLTLALDVNKLMVPTPTALDEDNNGNFDHRDTDLISSYFSSWRDAPEGDSELKEYMISIGAEYWYNDLFSLRAGYFHEDRNKGARQYATVGIGLKYNIFGLNISYLAPTASQNHPLANTLRFSLLFDFDELNN